MSKYTITIEGDFEKGECWRCPLYRHSPKKHALSCFKHSADCPLEELTTCANCDMAEYTFKRDKVYCQLHARYMPIDNYCGYGKPEGGETNEE